MGSDALVVSFLFVLYFVLIPAFTYLGVERSNRVRWRRRRWVPRAEQLPGGPFREQEPGRSQGYIEEIRQAPRSVKVVAVVSLVLGHMFIPGLFAGVFGLVFYGLGLVSIPGLVLAARIYRNAFGLLRCDLQAAVDARKLQRFAWTLNIVVLLLVLAMLPWSELHPLLAFTAVYAVISIVHAEGLGKAAQGIEAVHAGELEGLEAPSVSSIPHPA